MGNRRRERERTKEEKKGRRLGEKIRGAHRELEKAEEGVLSLSHLSPLL